MNKVRLIAILISLAAVGARADDTSVSSPAAAEPSAPPVGAPPASATPEQMAEWIAALGGNDSQAAAAAARSLGQAGVVDYSAIQALDRLSRDGFADKATRLEAAAAATRLQPSDASHFSVLLDLLPDVATERSFELVKSDAGLVGDAGLPALRSAYDAGNISKDLYWKCLTHVRTAAGRAALQTLNAESADRGPHYIPSRSAAAPDVTMPGYMRNEKKGD